MKKVVLLISHQPVPEQEHELKAKWKVKEIQALPNDLKNRWSQIPAEGEFPGKWLNPIFSWLWEQTSEQDLVWVQGEFGAMYAVVNWCHQHKRIPIYATTKRCYQSKRLDDGSILNQHVFAHVTFREYPT